MRSPLFLLLFLTVFPALAQPGLATTPTHREAAEALVSRFDRLPAYANYRQYRFSLEHPEAPGAFYTSVAPRIAGMLESFADTLADYYASTLPETQLVEALSFMNGPVGVRYNNFRRDGLWAQVHYNWFWESARRVHAHGDSVRRNPVSDWGAFGLRFATFPDMETVQARLDRENHSDDYWYAVYELAQDSLGERMAGVAKQFLGANERDSILAAFAAPWGGVLDPQSRGIALQTLYASFTKRLDDHILKAWRSYEYRGFRYPESQKTLDFRSQSMRLVYRGELPDDRNLDWHYDGVAWIIEVPGFRGKDDDYARLERWLSDFRFRPGGRHVVYFVRSSIPLPGPEEPYPNGAARALSAENLEAYMNTLPPKKRKSVVYRCSIDDGVRTWLR